MGTTETQLEDYQSYHHREILEEVAKNRRVVNNQYPTADTTLIENYLSRYINR